MTLQSRFPSRSVNRLRNQRYFGDQKNTSRWIYSLNVASCWYLLEFHNLECFLHYKILLKKQVLTFCYVCHRFDFPDLYEPYHPHIPTLSSYKNTWFTLGFLWYVMSKVKRCQSQVDTRAALWHLVGRSTGRHDTPHVLLVLFSCLWQFFISYFVISLKSVKCACVH